MDQSKSPKTNMTDINNNVEIKSPSELPCKISKPLLCFPTIRELGTNIYPPGHTPAGSKTNLPFSPTGSRSWEEDDDGLDTELEEIGPITYTSSTSQTDLHPASDKEIQTDDVLNEIPPLKPVLVIKKSRSLTSDKQTLTIKDTNSNLIQLVGDGETISTSSFSQTPPSPPPELDNAKIRSEDVKNTAEEIWESVGKTCTPLAANRRKPRFASTVRRPRKTYMVASETDASSRTGTVASSGSLASTSATSGALSLRHGGSMYDYPRMDGNNNYIYPYEKYSRMGSPMPRQSTYRSRSASARGTRNTYPHLRSVLKELKEKEIVFDRYAAINALKARVLRGEKVTHEEIKAIRNMTLPPHQRHLGWRLPWSKDLCCIKGLVHIPTPNKPAPERNTFGAIEDLRLPTDQITEEHWGRRQYVLNLAGFQDDDISLYLEGKNRLVIRAVRPDEHDERLATTITETIVLPPDLPADNLRIVRKPSGTTIIEESWRF